LTASRVSWSRRFDDPIPLPRGRQLVTLQDAGTYITKLPKAEHATAEWQAAMEALILSPSLQNQRRIDGLSPYLLLQSTLEECLRVLMNKPGGTPHLYEIHTAPQLPLVEGVLSGEHVAELARLRDFL
jgi:hypothetical protein